MYEEERLLGNFFVINIKVGFPESTNIESIDSTINYVTLLEIIKEKFSYPKTLLEEVASDIEKHCKAQFPFITYQTISIRKLNPPLATMVEYSEVVIEKKYDD